LLINEMVSLLSKGALLLPGPEKQHPLSQKLKKIRRVLIDAARSQNINEPWLDDWYLHINACTTTIDNLRWNESR